MASKAGRGAALMALGELIPRVGQNVIGQVQAGRDRKEDMKDRELQRELLGLDIAGKKKGLELKDIEIGGEKSKAERRKKALELTTKIEADIAAERIKRKQKQTIDQAIDKMTPQQLDIEYGARNPEEAKQLAYNEIQMPSGKTDEDIIAQYKPELEMMQFVDPQAQGLQTGITQRTKRAQQQEDITGAREFEMGKLATQQGFAQDQQDRSFGQQSKLQSQRLSAQERMLGVKADIAEKTREKKPLSTEAAKVVGLITSGVQGAQTLLNKLESDDLSFWEVTKGGKFVNPEVAIARSQASETLGRLNSGGAINNDELKTFKKLILDDTLMATKEGRKAIADNLRRYIQRGVQTGIDITGDPDFEKNRILVKPQQKQESSGTGLVKPFKVGKYTIEVE